MDNWLASVPSPAQASSSWPAGARSFEASADFEIAPVSPSSWPFVAKMAKRVGKRISAPSWPLTAKMRARLAHELETSRPQNPTPPGRQTF